MANVIIEEERYLRPAPDMKVLKGYAMEETLVLQRANFHLRSFGTGLWPGCLPEIQESVSKRAMYEHSMTMDELRRISAEQPIPLVSELAADKRVVQPFTKKEVLDVEQRHIPSRYSDVTPYATRGDRLPVDIVDTRPALEFLNSPGIYDVVPVHPDGDPYDWSSDDLLDLDVMEAFADGHVPVASVPDAYDKLPPAERLHMVFPLKKRLTEADRWEGYCAVARGASVFRVHDGDLYGGGFDVPHLNLPYSLSHVTQFPSRAVLQRMAVLAFTGDVSTGNSRLDTLLIHVVRNLVGRYYESPMNDWPAIVQVALVRTEMMCTSMLLTRDVRSVVLRMCFLFAMARLHSTASYCVTVDGRVT